MSRQIRVRVSPTGDVLIEAYGFKGSGCEAATKAIEEALGTKVSCRRKSDYWSQSVSQQNQQKVGDGGGES
ncbi:DUF2997 domain-containing protein [Luteolibacter yonseiensis]|uniref:DUF2997 domain-containing protein n=1 Tax=Luteolibacter yonseiensis TaxID=1144680 RepID=A0A934VDQ2_9BACT|nr:DUF2997 domain-containing protein [Luteolibacter yonseiensis]MBK1818271.1 DUF2997 domain-containing protein [Luteolibacter yonseiensis]